MRYFRLRAHLTLGAFTTAVAIAADVVVFSLVNALWLRPQSLQDPESLVVITRSDVVSDPSRVTELGLERLASSDLFSGVAGEAVTRDLFIDYRPHIVLAAVGAEVETLAVTPNYFSVLGVAVLGRAFDSVATGDEGYAVAIISDRLFRSRFGADPDVVGRTVEAMPLPLTIIGVAPKGFLGALRGQDVDLWVPHRLLSRLNPHARVDVSMLAIGRLRAGISASSAQQWFASSERRFDRLRRATPVTRVFGAAGDTPAVVFNEATFMAVVTITAAGVFFAGCGTLLGLLLVHYECKRRDLAIRIALGATHWRLLRGVAAEIVMLGTLVAGAGLLLAQVILAALPRFRLPDGPDFGRLDLSADWRVYVATVVASAVVVAAAAIPAVWRVFRQLGHRRAGLNDGSRTSSSLRFRRAVLALHAAVTTILIITAGLFVRSVWFGFSDRLGFDPQGLAFLSVQMAPLPPEGERPRVAADVAATHALLEGLRATPGVMQVALGPAPTDPKLLASLSTMQDVASGADVVTIPIAWLRAGPGYLSTIRARAVAGQEGNRYEAVVSDALARRLWPGHSAVGRHVRYGPFQGTVTGVVDLVVGSVRMSHQPAIVTFDREHLLPEFVENSRHVSIAVRCSQGAVPLTLIENRARAAFPEASQIIVQSAAELLEVDTGRQRMGAWLFTGFGTIALVLALGGVFGLIAYTLAVDRRSYGVMMALGAAPARIAITALRAGVSPVALGAIAGALISIPIAATYRAHLIGVESADPLTYAAAVGMLVALALVAGGFAARSAWSISPVEVLRNE